MSKLRVAVLYGGPSKEHEISVLTGEAMIDALGEKHYQVTPILINKDGEWQIGKKHMPQTKALQWLADHSDFVLIGLHGTFGEDGTIQALLDKSHIPYSGSGSHASRLAMKKHQTSLLYKDAGFNIPNEKLIIKGTKKSADQLLEGFDLPVIIKPEAQGSSVGMTKVTEIDELRAAVDYALTTDKRALIQEYIKGTEVSCGVIENEVAKLVALPPTELVPLKSDFFDYEAKYVPGATNEITPPNLPKKTIELIKKMAVSAHRVIGCSGYSRTDMIVKNGELFFIETNTLPGMTGGSILPQQAKAAGMTLSELLDLIVQAGLRKGVIID